MRPMTGRLVGSALALLTAAQVAAARIEAEEVSQGEIASLVRVDDVQRVGNTITARLENLSDSRLESVRVIVGESFRWANERHPGPDDPSRADVVMVSDPIPPRGTVVIRHTLDPRPERSDGWFKPTVEVVGVARYPMPDSPRVMAPPDSPRTMAPDSPRVTAPAGDAPLQ